MKDPDVSHRDFDPPQEMSGYIPPPITDAEEAEMWESRTIAEERGEIIPW